MAGHALTMKLRDYQQEGAVGIDAAWASGAQNVLYVLPCRGGKTPVVAAKILSNTGGSIAIAHRGFLVSQMSMTLARNGVRHRVLGGDVLTRECSRLHVEEFGKNYVCPVAQCAVASVDTLVRMPPEDPLFRSLTLWVTDEVHHLLNENKWGKCVAMFPQARGLGVTATPVRADGKGLGRHADGVMDAMVLGPTMGALMARGYVAQYRIYAPPSDIDLSVVPISAGGDYAPDPLRKAVHRSHIVGDVVAHYLRVAPGKLGMTFAVDVESAGEIAAAYRSAGVPAEAVSAKTPTAVRMALQRRHQRGELLQLVNVDLYGEGADIQRLEVVSMARPTQSYGLYVQQFCRPLNPDPAKPYSVILDHVGNVHRHGLPDAPREWTLDRREKRGSNKPAEFIPIRTCPECAAAYERVLVACPYCGHRPVPAGRSAPEQVDGDLHELSPEALARLRGEVETAGTLRIPYGAKPEVVGALQKHHRIRGEAQAELREAMALWAGARTQAGEGSDELRRVQREFFHRFGVDYYSAQALGRVEAEALRARIIDSSSNSR